MGAVWHSLMGGVNQISNGQSACKEVEDWAVSVSLHGLILRVAEFVMAQHYSWGRLDSRWLDSCRHQSNAEAVTHR